MPVICGMEVWHWKIQHYKTVGIIVMSAEWKDEELQQSLKSWIKLYFLFLQNYNPSPLKNLSNHDSSNTYLAVTEIKIAILNVKSKPSS